MPFKNDVQTIQLTRVNRLHFLLRPGNEKKLVPGLNRSSLLLYDSERMTCSAASVDKVFREMARGNSCYSLSSLEWEWRSFFSSIFSQEMSSIELSKLVAALLVIEPKWDFTIAPQLDKQKKNSIKELLVAYKQELDSYNHSLSAFSKACDAIIQQRKASISAIGCPDIALRQKQIDQIELPLNQMTYIRSHIIQEIKRFPCTIPRAIRLLDCLTNVVKNPSSDNIARLIVELEKHSSLKIVTGMLLGFAGIAIITGSLVLLAGTFGVLVPLSLMGVYGGLYLFNAAIGLLGFSLGLVPLTKGFEISSEGWSIIDGKKTMNYFVQLARRTPILTQKEASRGMERQVSDFVAFDTLTSAAPKVQPRFVNHDQFGRPVAGGNSFFQAKDATLSVRKRQNLPEEAQNFKAAFLPPRKGGNFSLDNLEAGTVYFDVEGDSGQIIYFKVCAAGYVDDMDGILISSLSEAGLEHPIEPDQLKNYLFDSGIISRRSELKKSDQNSYKHVRFNESQP